MGAVCCSEDGQAASVAPLKQSPPGKDSYAEVIEEGIAKQVLDPRKQPRLSNSSPSGSNNPSGPTGVTLFSPSCAADNDKDASRTRNLHEAVSLGRRDSVDRWISEGADVDEINDEGLSPVHIASQRGDTVLARELLSYGADIDIRDRVGKVPLHYAATYNQDALVRDLLSRGADVHAIDNAGKTPLHEAAEFSRLKVAKALLEARADVNRSSDLSGYSPFAVAVDMGTAEMKDFLMQWGGQLDRR